MGFCNNIIFKCLFYIAKRGQGQLKALVKPETKLISIQSKSYEWILRPKTHHAPLTAPKYSNFYPSFHNHHIHHPSLSFPHPSLLFSSVFIFALFCFSLLFRVSKPPIPIQTLLSFYFLTSIPSILALDFGSRGWFLMQQQFQSDCRLQGLDSVVDSLESLFFYLFFIFWRKRRCSCGSVSWFSSEWLLKIMIMI